MLNLDNLKAGVIKADWYDPEINPKLADFCRHYGVNVMPCRPATPQHKGKVERGVGYVRNNALKGHRFESVGAENRHLAHWETHVADTRIHGTTCKQVAALFEEERARLQPLPASLFPCYQEARRTVGRDSFVEVAKSFYEAPPEYIGSQVWVRWDSRVVRIINGRREQVQMHTRLEPGKFSRALGCGGMNRPLLESCRYWVERVGMLGTSCQRWAQAGLKVMLDGQGGDEQLASYPQFYGPFLLSLLNRGRLAEVLHEAGRLYESQGWTWADTARSLFLWHAPDFISGLARKIIPRQSRFPWATREFITGGERLAPPWKRPASYRHEVSTGWMSRMMLTQLTLPMLLHWEDRNSMAHSLEARVPFMDHKLVEFSLSLPDSFKISNGDTKVVLKSAMQGLVPRQVINRRDKKGFATPEENWLRQNPGNEWNRLLQQAASDSPEIFDKPKLDSMWQNFISSKQPAPPILWRAITFGVWRRVFDVQI